MASEGPLSKENKVDDKCKAFIKVFSKDVLYEQKNDLATENN